MTAQPNNAANGHDAEAALLGAVLLDPHAFPRIAGALTAEDFADPRHRTLFAAIAGTATNDTPADAVTVAADLERRGQLEGAGGREYVAGLVAASVGAANIEAYARIVRESADHRRFVALMQRSAADAAREPDLAAFVETHMRAVAEFGAAPRRAETWPAPLDLAALLAIEPSPPRMLVNDWLPCGYATLLAGHGGAGKSTVALHLAVCLATGRGWWGLRTERRRVLYASCEDRADVLHWRLSRILAHEGIAAGQLDGLRIVDLVGLDAVLYRRTSWIGSTTTAVYAELERLMAEQRADVLIVDGVADTFGANENDRGDVKGFVNTSRAARRHRGCRAARASHGEARRREWRDPRGLFRLDELA